jgi:hypothetical protein
MTVGVAGFEKEKREIDKSIFGMYIYVDKISVDKICSSEVAPFPSDTKKKRNRARISLEGCV